jgi:hypothetical protein
MLKKMATEVLYSIDATNFIKNPEYISLFSKRGISRANSLYDLNTQISATSPCIFETNQSQLKQLRPQQSEYDSQLESYKLSTGMLIFAFIFSFFRIVTLVMFIDIIFKSKKYKSIYNSEAKKIIVIINLVFAYLQIVIALFTLYVLQKYSPLIKKYNSIIIIFLIFFVVFKLYCLYLIS